MKIHWWYLTLCAQHACTCAFLWCVWISCDLLCLTLWAHEGSLVNLARLSAAEEEEDARHNYLIRCATEAQLQTEDDRRLDSSRTNAVSSLSLSEHPEKGYLG